MFYKCTSFNVINGKFLAKCSSVIKLFFKYTHENTTVKLLE